MRGLKTGGRVKGSHDLRPRKNARATSVDTRVTTTVAAGAGAAPPGPAPAIAMRVPAREAAPRKPRPAEIARKALNAARRAEKLAGVAPVPVAPDPAIAARELATGDMGQAAGVAPAGAMPAKPAARANGARSEARDGFPKHRVASPASLIPYERNARTHSPAQIDKLCGLIREFGWTNPILVAGNHILAGHARQVAALKLGLDRVPVIDLSHLTKLQRRAYILADNRSAIDAGWDDELLTLELGDLQEAGFDLALTGFDLGELATLFGDEVNEGLTDPDEVPPVPAVPVSRLGDVWLLGRHRLVCGDSTTAGAVDAALAGVKPHLMVTDPPYGVEYDADWRTTARNGDGSLLSTGTGRAKGRVENDTRADWSEAWALFPGDVAYVWCASLHIHSAAEALITSGFDLRASIIWAKSNFAISHGHYHWQHEPCWYAVRDKATGHWHGDRKQTTLWQIDKPQKSETGHSTQKPVECMKRPIENNSSAGQAVYDPFVGSGTTIIAAEMTGRACHAIELSPNYVDVAVRRWQSFTGTEATHATDGRTFAAIEAARTAAPAAAKRSHRKPATPQPASQAAA
jgi:DNA modification methylase